MMKSNVHNEIRFEFNDYKTNIYKVIKKKRPKLLRHILGVALFIFDGKPIQM